MGKILSIAWKDMKIRFKDRRGLLMNFLFPLVLIFILGMAGKGQMGGSDLVMNLKIAVFNADTGTIGQSFVKNVLQAKNVKEHISIIKATDADQVKSLVNHGDADVGLVLSKTFSDQIQKGKSNEVELYQNPDKTVAGQVVSSMMASYSNRVAATASAIMGVLSELPSAEIAQSSQDVSMKISDVAQHPKVSVNHVSTGGKQLNSLQYYAAAEIVLFLLFNAQNGAMSIINERTTETLGRLMTTPTLKVIILLGKFLGVFVYTLVQFGLLLFATRFLFGVNWGNHIGQILAVGTIFTAAIAASSLLLASFSMKEQAMESASRIGIYILGMLGGSMIPLYSFSNQFQTISRFTPNYWALNSFLNSISGTGTWHALLPVCAVMGGASIIVLLLGTWRLKLR